MKLPSRILSIAAVLVLAIGSDQLLKQAARRLLQFSPTISLLNDFIRLQYAENRGVMLSVGASLSPDVRFWVFIVGVGLLLVGMLAYIVWNKQLDRVQTIAWTSIVSGGLGNLIDRLTRDGAVVDYVTIGFGIIRTAVFNLADAWVFIGVFFLLIHRVKKSGTGQEQHGNSSASSEGTDHG